MKKFILLVLMFSLIVGCGNGSDEDEALQERMVTNQPIENPFFQESLEYDIEVEDDELLRFVNLNIRLGRIQAEAQQSMMDVLNEKDLTIGAYTAMVQTVNMGDSDEDSAFSLDDIEKYEEVKILITEIEIEVDEKFESAIAESGFSDERFIDLNVAVQQNRELMMRSQELLREDRNSN